MVTTAEPATALGLTQPDLADYAEPTIERRRRLRPPASSRRRLTGVALPGAALALVGIVHGVGMSVWPSFSNEDEGTYMARAWAVQTGLGAHHGPAPYTYWYDHPPFGWIQLSLWTWVTHAFRPGVVAVASGRADMLLYTLVCAALVYVVARRVGCTRGFATGALLLFGLSPLSVQNMRMVMLDTIGLPWILAAFALALSPRRRLWAFAASGLCLAAGTLSKETYLLMGLPLLWLIWQRAVGPTRRMCLTVFSVVCLATLAFYPLYAALKGELFAGGSHVSLIGAVTWQLYGRAGSGSVFTAGTSANQIVVGWLRLDPWLLGLGAVLLPAAFFVRQLRPIGAALAIFLVSLLRTGYLPATFITGALPFAALVVAGVANFLWRWNATEPSREEAARLRPRGARHSALSWNSSSITWGHRIAVGAVIVLVGVVALPQWARADRAAMTTDSTRTYRQAETWVTTHVPRSATMLVDDDMWIDLVDDGYPTANVVWMWELDQDPQVQGRFPGGWRQMDYVIVTPVVRTNLLSASPTLPSTVNALRHTTEVARFGSGSSWVSIYKVHPAHLGAAPWWLPGYGSGIAPQIGADGGEHL